MRKLVGGGVYTRVNDELLYGHADGLMEESLEMTFGSSNVGRNLVQRHPLGEVLAYVVGSYADIAQMRQRPDSAVKALHGADDADDFPCGIAEWIFIGDDPIWDAQLVEPEFDDVLKRLARKDDLLVIGFVVLGEAFGKIFARPAADDLLFRGKSAGRGIFSGVEHQPALRVLDEIIEARERVEGLEELSRIHTRLLEKPLADSEAFIEGKRLGRGGGGFSHVRILQVFALTVQDM